MEWIEATPSLFNVKINEIVETKIVEEDLTLEENVILQSIKMLNDEFHQKYPALKLSLDNVTKSGLEVPDIIQKSLAVLAGIAHQMSVLGDPPIDKERMQDIFEEMNLAEILRKLCLNLFLVKRKLAHQNSEMGIQNSSGDPYIDALKIMQNKEVKKPDKLEDDIKKIRQKMIQKSFPEIAKNRFEEEANNYLRTNKWSAESSVLWNYLNIIASLPWGISSTDNTDIEKAKAILEATHYGMDDIKQRIMEFLAVAKLKGKNAGKILCFHGAPGVGKTSIAESIAK